jgi:hypothetical protein
MYTALLLFTLLLGPSADDRIAVFVIGPLADEAGFVDGENDVIDSVSDLQSEIKHRRTLRLATTAADADIVLRVTARGIQSEEAGTLLAPVGRAVYLGPTYHNYHVVQAQIEKGDYRKDVSVGLNGLGGVWKECAEQISKSVEKWAVANRSRLLESRTK